MISVLLTILLSVMMMAGLFLMLLGGVGFIQDRRFFSSAPREVIDVVPALKPVLFPGQRAAGWAMIALSLALMVGVLVEIMRHGDDSVPEYMIWLQKGDFTHCPKVTFMYGSDETLYACAPSFEAAMKRYDVDYEMIVGEGMFHCYPVFPICREAKDGWKQMIQRMKENGYD